RSTSPRRPRLRRAGVPGPPAPLSWASADPNTLSRPGAPRNSVARSRRPGAGERRTLAPSWGRGGQDARDARGPGRAEARRGLEVVGENALSRARALVYDTPPSWSTFLRQRRRPRRPHRRVEHALPGRTSFTGPSTR